MAAKQGVKVAIKRFAQQQIEHLFKNYMSKNIAKQFVKELDDILGTLDNTWWETGLELIPYQFTLGTWSERRFGFPNPAPKMKSIDGAVLTPHGAAHPVAAGNSPAFLYQGMMRYNPKK